MTGHAQPIISNSKVVFFLPKASVIGPPKKENIIAEISLCYGSFCKYFAHPFDIDSFISREIDMEKFLANLGLNI